ncbi:hypothetical protein ACVMFA_007330 [Bradyrhizobium liaoningense]
MRSNELHVAIGGRHPYRRCAKLRRRQGDMRFALIAAPMAAVVSPPRPTCHSALAIRQCKLLNARRPSESNPACARKPSAAAARQTKATINSNQFTLKSPIRPTSAVRIVGPVAPWRSAPLFPATSFAPPPRRRPPGQSSRAPAGFPALACASLMFAPVWLTSVWGMRVLPDAKPSGIAPTRKGRFGASFNCRSCKRDRCAPAARSDQSFQASRSRSPYVQFAMSNSATSKTLAHG